MANRTNFQGEDSTLDEITLKDVGRTAISGIAGVAGYSVSRNLSSLTKLPIATKVNNFVSRNAKSLWNKLPEKMRTFGDFSEFLGDVKASFLKRFDSRKIADRVGQGVSAFVGGTLAALTNGFLGSPKNSNQEAENN